MCGYLLFASLLLFEYELPMLLWPMTQTLGPQHTWQARIDKTSTTTSVDWCPRLGYVGGLRPSLQHCLVFLSRCHEYHLCETMMAHRNQDNK